MYSEFTRTIETSFATELVITIVENASQVARVDEELRQSCDCERFGPACVCRYSNSAITTEGFVYEPDYYSGTNTVTFPEADTLLLTGNAGAGTHTLSINIRTGELTVTHSGRRRSYPGNAMNLLPESWWEINDATNWRLVTSESSRTDWAVVAGFLTGKYGEGPENLEEAEYLQEQVELAEIRRKAQAVGRELPGLYKDFLSGQWLLMEDGHPWRPKWTGLEYRRAGAMGVTL